jgi:predicted DCC family thiol-disulfide oxidoreductase YuxK
MMPGLARKFKARTSEGTMADTPFPTPLILYDGVCPFCTASVLFVIRRDPRKRFHFAALQSPLGRTLLARYRLPQDAFQTFVLITEDGHDTRSTAALKVARELGGPWPLLYGFILVPAPIRDLVYRIVARHRYRWFGKRDACLVPSADIRDRFVDAG